MHLKIESGLGKKIRPFADLCVSLQKSFYLFFVLFCSVFAKCIHVFIGACSYEEYNDNSQLNDL